MLSTEWGIALISGGIVATAQLVVAYFLLDKYVQHIQLKSEQQKWNAARKELCASMLYFAYGICRPIAHYCVSSEATGRVHPRTNILQAFEHVEDKSQEFVSLISIYANAIPVDWYARIAAACFELQRAAENAGRAKLEWAKVETIAENEDKTTEPKTVFDGNTMKVITGSDRYVIPKTSPDREIAFFLFSYYHLLVGLADTAQKLDSIVETILDGEAVSKLDNTEVFERLAEISKERSQPFSAGYFHERMSEDLSRIRSLQAEMCSVGVSLKPYPEFD